ncbi:hypothetical protein PDIP_03040 [Penicillium digitatum Pd1]|uniref:Uncharacterized protein n=1 Tax=Penicillium digitatum (strain Pd1 / CECT 20795) TaxID=1170230 RepID=K9GKP1_PEND1|nr:hypothetical protein PDIP_03040 [Penicillium digitatum Pd1]EKV21827.1 hypothetical protein PDIP_03040 [Penicillium digitatum Pd1]
MGPILQQLQALPARSRQGLNNLRQRIFQQDILRRQKGERQPKEANFLLTSLSVHRPVWITAGGSLYTSMAALCLTMRYLKRFAR